MSKAFQKWVESKDDFIKTRVQSVAKQLGLDANFKGYYIEDNDYRGTTEAFPLFKTIKHYDEDTVSTKFINHIRYFFELTDGEQKYMATVHFSEADHKTMLCSIEETFSELALNNNEITTENFEGLKSLMIKKFSQN